ncbi:hypothetical protein JCM3775_000562 [Rhodotorula graminis]
MPVYKHVAASQKRSKRKAEQLLSDEEDDLSASDNSDASQDEADTDSGSDQTDSDDDDSADEDDGLGGVDDVLGEDDPRPPPKGFPNALEALENQVVSSALLVAAAAGGESGDEAAKGGADGDDEDDEELPLICVVCPNKVLKKGKMTDVHLASKDHKRRFARFSAHVQADDFPPEFALSDARWVSSQLDKAVIERLSMQTLVGGKKAGTATAPAAVEEKKEAVKQPETPAKKGKGKEKATTPAAAAAASTAAPSSAADTPAKASNAARKAEAVAAAEKEGISVREQLRRAKKEKEAKRAQRKKEKNERVKRRKLEKGEEIPARPPTKRFVEKIKPTEDEIAARQAWKKARDEAKAAGQPVPPRPVLAHEHGGKAPARLVKQHAQKKEAFEAKVQGGGGGETRKRERKERRKDKASAAAAKGDEVLAEV